MSTPDPREAAVAGLALFPPSLRISALESKSFRDDVGLSVDAIIQLDEIGTAFRRSALFKNIRALLSGNIASAEIMDRNNKSWTISLDKEKHGIRITAGERTYL